MTVIKHVSYEEVEDYDAYDFYLMKRNCACEKEFKTIGIERGMIDAQKIIQQFKQTIPTKNIHPKQMVTLYSED
jgi:hypothetical protein